MLFSFLKAGFSLGLLLGLIDLGVRILSLNIDWVQFYQALLVPILIWPLAFFFIGTIALPALKVLRKLPNETDLGNALWGSVIAIPLCLTVWLIVQFFVLGDVQSISKASEMQGGLIFFVTVLAGIAFLAALRSFNVTALRENSAFKALCSNLKFLAVTFTVLLFAYDLYGYYLWLPPARQSEEAQTEKPNIILITLDTLRADFLGSYADNKGASPFLDSVAKQSVLFEQAYSPAPWTLPSHSGIFTGLRVNQHGAHFGHQLLNEQLDTLAELLSAEGYRSAGFISGPFMKAKFGVAQGFDLYRDRLDFFEYRFNDDWASTFRLLSYFSYLFKEKLFQSDGERIASEILPEANKWLDQESAKPFFLFLNLFDVHAPYSLGAEYRKMFTERTDGNRVIDLQLEAIHKTPATRYAKVAFPKSEVEFAKALYLAELRWMDERLKEFFAELKSKGQLKNTVVIFTADHGEEFFEHGNALHSDTLYNELIKVPLFVWAPQRFSPARLQSAVSTIDIFPTVLELLNLKPSAEIAAESLLPQLKGEERISTRKPILAERFGRGLQVESSLFAAIEYPDKLIRVFPERERIPNSQFQLDSDPAEQNNLYQSEEDERARAEMQKALEGSRLYQQLSAKSKP